MDNPTYITVIGSIIAAAILAVFGIWAGNLQKNQSDRDKDELLEKTQELVRLSAENARLNERFYNYQTGGNAVPGLRAMLAQNGSGKEIGGKYSPYWIHFYVTNKEEFPIRNLRVSVYDIYSYHLIDYGIFYEVADGHIESRLARDHDLQGALRRAQTTNIIDVGNLFMGSEQLVYIASFAPIFRNNDVAFIVKLRWYNNTHEYIIRYHWDGNHFVHTNSVLTVNGKSSTDFSHLEIQGNVELDN